MADIFISYSKSHRPLTADLAAELEARGYSVWWDTSLVAGDSYRDVILTELAQARAAIVIWSSASVKSSWVISEATRAQRRGILIPVRAEDLDPDDIPPPFDVLHTELVSNRAGILAALTKRGVPPPAPKTKMPETRAPEGRAPEPEAKPHPAVASNVSERGVAAPEHARKGLLSTPILAIAIAAVVVLGLTGHKLFPFFSEFAKQYGLSVVLMVPGWTAWVCFCALVYSIFEKLFPTVLGPRSENG